MTTRLEESLLWGDARLLPDVLGRVLDGRRPDRAAALLLEAGRIVATGNGAAFYAALALESAARAHPARAAFVTAVPAGILGSGDFEWLPGDVPVVFSSSGELRDIVELLRADRFPERWVAVTANPPSTLGAAATERVDVPVLSQRAVTHTQAFVANVLTALLLWQEVCGRDLELPFDDLVERSGAAIAAAPGWAAGIAPTLHDSMMGIALSSGAGWSAAMETALLFKEVAGVPVEGFETREAATTGMYALAPGSLVLSHASEADAAGSEAERICAAMGARIVRLPVPDAPSLLVPILSFPAALALAGAVGLDRDRDIDTPPWTAAYFETARVV